MVCEFSLEARTFGWEKPMILAVIVHVGLIIDDMLIVKMADLMFRQPVNQQVFEIIVIPCRPYPEIEVAEIEIERHDRHIILVKSGVETFLSVFVQIDVFMPERGRDRVIDETFRMEVPIHFSHDPLAKAQGEIKFHRQLRP